MKSKALFSFIAPLTLSVGLLLTAGCGGGDESDGAGSSAELPQLEAQAAAGDASAAYKAGEIYSGQDTSEARIAALKWFYVSRDLGNADASLAIVAVEQRSTPDELLEANRQATALKPKE